MIICFSGTGNSLLVARQLQSHLGGDILMLEGRRLIEPDSELIRVPEGEPVVWVMPVYSWGIPPVVVPFLRRSKLKITPEHSTPHFLVLTCGDDTGYADHQWAKIIGRRGWNPRGSFSVIMPNTYVLMKGFDVDTPEVADAKLKAMPDRVAHIAAKISKGYGEGEMTRGSWAWLKTYIIYPWFAAFCMPPRPFHATAACTSCSLCARSCPLSNITMSPFPPSISSRSSQNQEGSSVAELQLGVPGNPSTPVWGSRCALCLRCYHICPSRAVAYGSATASKSRKPVYR